MKCQTFLAITSDTFTLISEDTQVLGGPSGVYKLMCECVCVCMHMVNTLILNVQFDDFFQFDDILKYAYSPVTLPRAGYRTFSVSQKFCVCVCFPSLNHS